MGGMTVRNKLKKAFSELGADMKKDSCGLYIVKYNLMDYFLELDEKESAFCILQTVMGLQGKLSQGEFDMLLDVLKSFHNEYNGEWNEGLSYVYSPWYNINESNEFNSKCLEKIIEDFFRSLVVCLRKCLPYFGHHNLEINKTRLI